MKLELIQKGDKYAIKTWWLGFIPMYWAYDEMGYYGWDFEKEWMDEKQAKQIYKNMISGISERDKFNKCKESVISNYEY